MRVTLPGVLDGSQDGRSVQGLKRAAERKMNSREHKNDGYVLNNYYKLVTASQALAPGHFASTPDAEISRVVALLEEEGVDLPACTKESITMRRIDSLVAESNFEQLLPVINPFSTTSWNPSVPNLSALGGTDTVLKIWQRVLFEEALCNLLSLGTSGAGKVSFLMKLTLKMLDDVDMVDLSAAAAAYVEEAFCILHCLKDLLEPSFEASALDPGLVVCKTCVCPLHIEVLVEEHVRRVKTAGGRTQKSTLQMIGAAIESSQFWANLVSEYLVKAASTVEKRPQILRYHEALETMPDADISSVEVLTEIMQQVPGFLLAVRSSALDSFMCKLKSKIESYRAVVTAGTSTKLSSSDLKRLDQLFSAAAILWPLDLELQNSVNLVLEQFHKVGKTESLTLVSSQCKLLSETAIETQSEFIAVLESLSQMLQETDFKDSFKGGDANRQNLIDALTTLLSFVQHHWAEPNEQLQLVQQCANAMKQLISALGMSAWETWASVLESTIAMGKTYGELKHRAENAAPADYCRSLASLERRVKTVVFAENYWESVAEPVKNHALFTTLEQYKTIAVDYSATVKASCLQQARVNLECAVDELSTVSKVKGSNEWLSGFTGSTLEDLVTHAQGTLFKMQAEALDGAITTLQQACGLTLQTPLSAFDAYKLVFQSLESTMQEQLLASARSHLKEAVVTKVSGVLLAFFQESPDDLRSRVQIEIKCGLRANGLHEGTCLHPILLAKVQKTLKCQV
eukprot:5838260-Amphidinium_carterae.1